MCDCCGHKDRLVNITVMNPKGGKAAPEHCQGERHAGAGHDPHTPAQAQPRISVIQPGTAKD